jgi:hypothetical protein
MPSPDPFLIFLRPLNALAIPYMVTGSIAAIYYGEPRLTNDIDLVVFLKPGDAALLANAFPEKDFYCPPEEVLMLEAEREQRGHFNLLHHESGWKADVYVMGRDPLHAWGMARARVGNIDGEEVRFAPPEYVIVRKLEFFREGGSEKHIRDVMSMLLGMGDWDTRDLIEMIGLRKLDAEWRRCSEPPPRRWRPPQTGANM